ncbi:MAG: hypothetical protein ACD_34C00438G0002 [uncultured bacterium]|nr:MAG: hypothetical protein ACD_34C00438G0002 [uncultured bacterium]HCS40740.1 hypothetical protein [Anaerolineaceae bacterium]
MPTLSADLLWMLVSFILTLMVFSYLFGDNALFRFVSALFIGATTGYIFVILIFQVVLPRLVAPILNGSVITLIPLILSGLLLMKLSPKLAKFGNISMAYLVGTGAAVAIGGAVLGTLFGQIKGTLTAFDSLQQATGTSPVFLILEGTFMLVGTIATLVYFNFGAKKTAQNDTKRGWISAIFAWIGQFFIAITLGAVFAGVLTTAITALVERMDFILQSINTLMR